MAQSPSQTETERAENAERMVHHVEADVAAFFEHRRYQANGDYFSGKCGNDEIRILAAGGIGDQQRDFHQMIDVRLLRRSFPTLMYMPPGGCISRLEHLEPFLASKFFSAIRVTDCL